MTETKALVHQRLPGDLANLTLSYFHAASRTRKEIAMAGEYEEALYHCGPIDMKGACIAGHPALAKAICERLLSRFNSNKSKALIREGLAMACSGGDMETIRTMLEFNINGGRNRCLRMACENGHIVAAELMIAHGANNLSESSVNACYFGHLGMVKFLVSKGTRDLYGGLMTACAHGRSDIAEYIMTQYANEKVDPIPIHCFCSNKKHSDLCQTLRDRGGHRCLCALVPKLSNKY